MVEIEVPQGFRIAVVYGISTIGEASPAAMSRKCMIP